MPPSTTLDDCPSSPNCVCTTASRESQQMDPLAYAGKESDAIEVVKKVLQGYPRVKVVSEQADYLHAVFTSLIFRFRDDVEFKLDPDAKLLHFRSASRVGYSDLGANRKRMTEIVNQLKKHSAFAEVT